MLLHFDETPEAEEAQIQACDEQHITLPGDDSQAALHIPVHMSQGQLISPFLCQLTVHGLPPSLARRGIGQQLLSRAGYSSQECTVEGEFMGDLPTQYASQQAAGGVGNADACLIFIRPPPGDRELLRMPKSFRIGEDRIHISRPGQRLATHTQPLKADSQVVTHREGPRTIRTRQRVQRAARRAAAAEPSRPAPAARPTRCSPFSGAAIPQSPTPTAGSLRWDPAPGAAAPSPAPEAAAPGPPAPDSRVPGSHSRATGTRAPVSPELRALEATVAGSRHSSTDRRGLGSTLGRQTASAGQTRFTRASPAAQPQDMDCSPPMGAIVLPPLHQCDSMDADDPEPQTAQPAVPGAQPMDVCAPQLSEDIRDELMHWMDAHTALTFLTEAMPWPGYTLRSLMTSQPSPSHSTSMPLSRPLMRLRRRGSRLWILRCAGAALPQLSLRALRHLLQHARQSRQP
ncbi:g2765 [Coccomyxa viridis]|uniref:G2765 protein n=1 Tax=Coccomyxa viridis TaxID=1274662 RepID=A0ABP1FNH4_9CHLO